MLMLTHNVDDRDGAVPELTHPENVWYLAVL
jgi:hypothetical protein